MSSPIETTEPHPVNADDNGQNGQNDRRPPAVKAEDNGRNGQNAQGNGVGQRRSPAPPSAKKPRLRTDLDDERVARAARLMVRNAYLSVPQAMLCNGYTDAECKDRALQQRVRRLHARLGRGVVDAETLVDIERESTEHLPFADRARDFLDRGTCAFAAVKECGEALDAAGFVRLSKREPFGGKLVPGGCYYYTINRSTVVAFAIGGKYQAGNGFKIIGGHTDSPHLKVKPLSKRAGSGCVQLGVECYGGGLWHTWFDRDLGISGRVLVRKIHPETGRQTIEQHIVRIRRPVARVSTLCIHLQTAEERRAFAVNKEEHLSPVVGTQRLLEAASRKRELQAGIQQQLNQASEEEADGWRSGQEPALMGLIASELSVETKQIVSFDLGLFDTQPASLGGIKDEFLNSSRLDNLATVFIALEAVLDYSKGVELAEDDMISLIACFDHEEIGSTSTHGAGSPVMVEAVSRITSALGENARSRDPEAYASAVRRSFILSVDQAHAIHPNYASKHEKSHGPRLNAGVVIKTNQNQRYATNAVTGFIVRELARKGTRVPIQDFVVRSDCPCGSTIGPVLSASTGIRTVDLGMPQLSMHSIREVMGVADLTHGYNLFKSFFKYFNKIDTSLEG